MKKRVVKVASQAKIDVPYWKKAFAFDIAKVHIEKRVDKLRDLEGWYDYACINDEDSQISEILKRLREELGETIEKEILETHLIRGTRIGRFLISQMEIKPDLSARFVESIQRGRFFLSCRFNDFLRIAETKHYRTCMTNWRGLQMIRDLADSDLCVIFEPDRAGKMKCRCKARLLIASDKIYETRMGEPTVREKIDALSRAVIRDGETILGLYRIYGNGFSHRTITKALSEKICCTKLLPSYRESHNFALSFSVVRNPAVQKPIWSDHGAKLVDGRLVFGINECKV